MDSSQLQFDTGQIVVTLQAAGGNAISICSDVQSQPRDCGPLTQGNSSWLTISIPDVREFQNLIGPTYFLSVFDYASPSTGWANQALASTPIQFVRARSGGTSNRSPNASLSFSPQNPVAGQPVQFSDQSSDPDGDAIVSWSWSFQSTSANPGLNHFATSSLQNPSHVFPAPGLYVVNLTVWDSQGASGTSGDVQVVVDPASSNSPPSGDFTFQPTSPGVGQTVQFNDASTDPDGNQDITSWRWDFGDGASSSTQDPTHAYHTSGSFTVQLTVTDSDGNSDTTTARIRVSSSANQPPSAGFSVSSSSPQVGQRVSFTDSSTDPDGASDIQSWQWSFGDGANSSAQNPSHTYPNAGTFTVTLTVTDGSGATASATRTIAVGNPNVGNSTPTAQFNFSPQNPQQGQAVNFTDQSSDPDGTQDLTAWRWDFGDGSTSTVQQPTHTYALSGAYTVRLTVTDSAGNTNTDTRTITIGGRGTSGATITSLQDADTNGDCRLDSPEFLAVIDAWVRRDVPDALFFDAIDAWVQETDICASSAALSRLALHALSLSQSTEAGIGFTVHGEGIEGMRVDVYDLNGHRVFRRDTTGQALIWRPQTTLHGANGTYLYRVTVRGANGELMHSEIHKLTLLR